MILWDITNGCPFLPPAAAARRYVSNLLNYSLTLAKIVEPSRELSCMLCSGKRRLRRSARFKIIARVETFSLVETLYHSTQTLVRSRARRFSKGNLNLSSKEVKSSSIRHKLWRSSFSRVSLLNSWLQSKFKAGYTELVNTRILEYESLEFLKLHRVNMVYYWKLIFLKLELMHIADSIF